MNNSILKRIVYILLMSFLMIMFFSCTPTKNLLYLQGIDNDSTSFVPYEKVDYKINSGDVLFIKISSIDPATDQMFNMTKQDIFNLSNISLYVQSYSVNDSGYIDLPMLGSIYVKGLSVHETKMKVVEQVSKYFKEINVVVKLVSYQITILGEVKAPGVKHIYKDEINIFEAIGLAGDLTDYGKRENVKVVRKTNEGSKIYSIDLRDKNIINTPYYYVHPNDVIYVEQNNTKRYGIRNNAIQISLSAITALVVVLNYFKN